MADQLKKLQYLSLVSKVTTEIESHLGIADKTLSEFIIDLSKGKQSVQQFRTELRQNGADMPDPLVETLWNIIQKLLPGDGKGSNGQQGGSQFAPKPGVKYGGLAVPDSRDRVKQLEEEIIAEGQAKRAAERQQQQPEVEPLRGRENGERHRDRSRDNSRDRHRDGDRDRERDRRRERYRSRSRSRSPQRRRRGGSRSPDRGRRRDRSGSPGRGAPGRGGRPPPQQLLDEPEVYAIYKGRVANVMDFGCFVELHGFSKKVEGLVHLSNISSTKKGGSAKELVSRGAPVFVKVVSKTGQRVSLSMRDVDQATGEDLLPMGKGGAGQDLRSNPAGPASGANAVGNMTALHGLSGIKVRDESLLEDKPRRRGRRMTSPERWEIAQLIKAGVLDVSEYPEFNEEEGGLVHDDEGVEEEFEIDMNDEEPLFLKGVSSRSGAEMSPIKIVKNPDGSMQRAAMTQSALAKERRELREQQQRTLLEAIPKDLSRPWEDPLADAGERALAQELRGIGLGAQEMPEWKKQEMPEWKKQASGEALGEGRLQGSLVQ
ncbi:hypothetical protein N2152v2_005074 [Parachlorella kessleri]